MIITRRREDAKKTIEGAMRGHGGRGIGFGATKSAKNTENAKNTGKLRDEAWLERASSSRRAGAAWTPGASSWEGMRPLDTP